MMDLLIATGNQGKMLEFAHLFEGYGVKLYSLKDFPGFIPPAEDGNTFLENAVIKGVAAARATGLAVISDDSGLCVDSLDGAPGVFSARYAGEGASDGANNEKLLAEMAGIPLSKRTAAFRCALAFTNPDGEHHLFEGELKGIILQQQAGNSGFGYDPLFMVPEYGKTLAELPLEVKNRISHRGVAAGALKKFLLDSKFLQSKA